MMPQRQGSFHLFRLAGIDLYLHWSWFLVAAFEISARSKSYSSIFWNVLEYVALFLIVALHEFGHSLACRQVGGIANRIVLWPLGGVAFVDPPPRPGAVLWSIAAGPLVNVVLAPCLTIALLAAQSLASAGAPGDAYSLLRSLWFMNLGLLLFNLLPVYPLDGGQILRALLWFAVGRARSLMIASYIGLVGVAALVALALFTRSVWGGVIALFIVLNCWGGLRQARLLFRLEKAPRHDDFACPFCHAAPPRGAFWSCSQCRKPFDTFETRATCPHCGTQFATTRCVNCGHLHPLSEWETSLASPPGL